MLHLPTGDLLGGLPPSYELLVGERRPEICGARGCITRDPLALAHKGTRSDWKLKSSVAAEPLAAFYDQEVSQRGGKGSRLIGSDSKHPRPDWRTRVEGERSYWGCGRD